jgi:hypothetical protein
VIPFFVTYEFKKWRCSQRNMIRKGNRIILSFLFDSPSQKNVYLRAFCFWQDIPMIQFASSSLTFYTVIVRLNVVFAFWEQWGFKKISCQCQIIMRNTISSYIIYTILTFNLYYCKSSEQRNKKFKIYNEKSSVRWTNVTPEDGIICRNIYKYWVCQMGI